MDKNILDNDFFKGGYLYLNKDGNNLLFSLCLPMGIVCRFPEVKTGRNMRDAFRLEDFRIGNFLIEKIPWAGVLFFLLCSFGSWAQQLEGGIYLGRPNPLDTVVVVAPAPGEYSDQQIRILRYRVYKVWPYALLGSQYLEEILEREEEKKRDFRKRVDSLEDELRERFEKTLKGFSQSDGRALIKLIHRQSGLSAYEITRRLKSGWRAFWWNATAGMFHMNLKSEYDPSANYEDALIEAILQEGFSRGILTPAPSFREPESPFYEPEEEIGQEKDSRQPRRNRDVLPPEKKNKR